MKELLNMEKSAQDLLGLIVHSYNNFLSGTIGFSELAKMESGDQNVQEKLDLVINSGEDAVDFGRQILASIGRLQVEFKPVDFLALLKQLCDEYSIELNDKLTTKDYCVLSDQQWLMRSLKEVFEFLKNMDDEPNLHCSVESNDNKIVVILSVDDLLLNVSDTEKLFHPFFSSRKLLGNKNMGLAYVQGFIAQMNGDISWDNELGFVIALPVAS